MKTILIVEDDAVFLEFIKTSVQSYLKGHKVITAENGKIAKDIIKNQPIDVLLTDIMMPEVDGLSLLAFINDREYAIPCFVMSAYGTPEIKKLIPKDVLHFFSKPFPVDKLGPALEGALKEGVPQGSISGITVASFLLLVELEKKTCLFEIVLEDGKKGFCYFNKGVLFNAAFEDLRGEEAALTLLHHEKASFSFKPLPKGKNFRRHIDKDLTTLIRESQSQAQDFDPMMEMVETVLVDYNDIFPEGIIEEPAEEDEATTTRVNVDDAEKHRLNLEGTFQDFSRQVGGRMRVVDMCTTHIILEVHGQSELFLGNTLQINFVLDDKCQSHIHKDVTIELISPPYVRCAFSTSHHYDRLGPYLHFNFLDRRSI